MADHSAGNVWMNQEWRTFSFADEQDPDAILQETEGSLLARRNVLNS